MAKNITKCVLNINNELLDILDSYKLLIEREFKAKNIFNNCLKIIKDDPDLENYKSSELKRELLKGVELYENDNRERQDS
jgi:hypothetical protein